MNNNDDKKHLPMIVIFIIFALILDILIYPTILNLILFRIAGFPEEVIEGLAFLRWDLGFKTNEAFRLTIAFHLLYIVFLITIYAKLSGIGKSNRGDEYGSARLMTDKEFDALVPNYIYREDEYNYPSESETKDLSILPNSNIDIFSELEFKEVPKDEKETNE